MKNEDLSTNQIIKLALNESDEDKRWNYVTVLHTRATGEVFDAAVNLCASGESRQVELGADILSQLGTRQSETGLPFQKDSVPILIELADSKLRSSENEDDIDALHSVVIALGKIANRKADKKIFEFRKHPSAMIRKGVASGLSFAEDDFAIKALTELSGDSDEDVRNWATFGLGQSDADTEEIREALLSRLNEDESDIGQEIIGEALVGLAQRKDERVVGPLLKQLSGNLVGTLAVEAAFEIADKRFCAALMRLKEWWDVDKNLLDEAIKNCCGSEYKEPELTTTRPENF